jgi:plastocyanin
MMMQFMANDLLTTQNYLKQGASHPLYDDFWAQYTNPSPERIEVPMLSAGGLNDPDLHLRGNVNSFIAARSPYKKLLLYSGTHWGSSFQPWANRTVLRFFDHWLKGIDTGIESEPAIDVQLRTGSDTFTHVYGNCWPLEQTEWTKYYIDAGDKALSLREASEESSITAELKSEESGTSEQVTFLTAQLEEDVAIAGPLTAHLWVSSSKHDVDLTIELRDFDENGKETMFAYVFAGRRDETVTRGWLRASHRALDPERTLPHQPYHPHTHNDWLTPGVPVAVDVEIWPTSMLFKAGHRIGLTVHCGPYKRKGEVMAMTKLPLLSKIRVPMYRSFSPSSGTTRIHTGGEHSSWLELPVIPADPDPAHRVTIDDSGFTPELSSGQPGDRFEWTNSGDDYHSVTESSGLGLWDSQIIRGVRSHNPETWWTRIPWAGTFNYRDEVSGFEGAIEIPIDMTESSAKGSQVNIEVGVAPPPEGIAFDVQLKEGDGDWSTIHEGIRDTRITITKLPSGNYAVRSRLRRIDAAGTTAESGWSPPLEFAVK